MNKTTINEYISANEKILEDYINFKINLCNHLLEIEKNEDWWKDLKDSIRVMFSHWIEIEGFIEPRRKNVYYRDWTQISTDYTLTLKGYREYLVLLNEYKDYFKK